MKLDDIYEVIIVDEDNNGNGITKINNFVVFVPGVLKDEKVRIKIVNVKKRFALAEVLKILIKSEKRESVLCPYYYECGGCSYLHLNYNDELEKKNKKLKELFNDVKVNDIIYINEYNYRNKVVFHVENGRIGFYKKDTHDLVEINNCLLLDSTINELLNKIKKLDLTNIDNILIRNLNQLMVVFSGTLKENDINLLKKNKSIETLYVNDKLIKGNNYIIEEINNLKFVVSKESFFQINKECMISLYDKVKEYSSTGENLLDLYCGTGTIGIYLSSNYKKILGIEVVKEAIENANINKQINDTNNIEFICADASYLKDKKFDCIIIDPPRSGLSKKVITNILETKAKKVIYVSCNPVTLKRDLENLKRNYTIREITPFNMFPKTSHIEVVVLLSLKDNTNII